MAKLTGKSPNFDTVCFNLTPVPSETGESDEYELQFSTGDGGQLFSRSVSVAHWQLGHSTLWYFAKRCRKYSSLANEQAVGSDAKLPLNVESGWDFVNCTWMHAVFRSNPRHTSVAMYLYLAEQGDSNQFKSYYIRSSIEQFAAFGDELAREIIQAAPGWAAENSLITNRKPKCAPGQRM